MISESIARELARSHFGLEVTAKRLDGEYDANFRLTRADGRHTHLLRVSHAGEALANLQFQNAMLTHLDAHGFALSPRVAPSISGETVTTVEVEGGRHYVRLLGWLPGKLLAHARPHLPALLADVGRMLGQCDTALQGFQHAGAERALKWDLANAGWVANHVGLIDDKHRRAIVERHITRYVNDVQPQLRALRRSVTHNDANDYNLLVTGTGYDARAAGLIDFGDALETATVCNLAIALAYLMLGKRDPMAAAQHVVRGYHSACALTEGEIALLHQLACMRLTKSVVNSALRKQHSDDPYVTISEAPAWALLERLERENPDLCHYKLRHACGLEPVPQSAYIVRWLKANQHGFASPVNVDLRTVSSRTLDLSVGSLDLGLPDTMDSTAKFTQLLEHDLGIAQTRDQHEVGTPLLPGIGRHNEPRLIYANDDFATETGDGVEYRTVHIGLDVFQPAGSPVFAPLDGVVHSFADNTARLDYGPCIILQHEADGAPFYTLYGHLARTSLAGLHVGQRITRGQQIATMGPYPENGDWPPHLHFQVIVDLLGFEGTYPGVARPSDRAVWLSLSPDPNLVLGIAPERLPESNERANDLLAERKSHAGGNLSLSYREPLAMARAIGQHMYDECGRKFLDGYNNVPHVGHNHPHVVRSVQRQLAVLNTNTRYLHGEFTRYARRLAATLPEPLSVVFLVASGSEATELAIRLARAHTGRRDLIVSDGAYHGHTNTLIDISPYKAEGPGGEGLPAWVHKAAVPDVFRGAHRGPDAGARYAADVAQTITQLAGQGQNLCGFIIESIPSVGGQIVLPDGYLAGVYSAVRQAGGLCIADEVQTGFGRTGKMWAFEHYGVVPDIVALGKPIGNGYPMGAVITTPAIAASFNNGMEFFSTFGGSTAACAAGNAVLDVVERESLTDHAHELGQTFITQLRQLQPKHPIVGDVRGLGLMLGIELVNPGLVPVAKQAGYCANRMKDKGILIGTDGIDHNVLKIRGPMCMNAQDVNRFVAALESVLAEDGAQPDEAYSGVAS